jgi:hypothetical protein
MRNLLAFVGLIIMASLPRPVHAGSGTSAPEGDAVTTNLIGKTVRIALAKDKALVIMTDGPAANLAKLDPKDKNTDKGLFRVTEGILDKKMVSFESVAAPGSFLCGTDWRLWVRDKAQIEPRLATFFFKKGVNGVMIMAASDPSHAITLKDKLELWLLDKPTPAKSEFKILPQ